ncbi:hypothetical protein N7495_005129 [Penicillium taxi]|uniref:uncharacterized protein n=1 Tax=Penicillium taxi TaxID=168475 RepID=UPI0025459DA6|nr:uncharacterized protein N7495_005129 [Penicillium taxi]KAJ5893438.1 hypothetical protein N7495_005129 [Penicillium taxi]
MSEPMDTKPDSYSDDEGAGEHVPLALVHICIGQPVFVKLRGDREIKGILHAFDGHCNAILGDAEETIYLAEMDENSQETRRTVKRQEEMLFVRGDSVVMISALS